MSAPAGLSVAPAPAYALYRASGLGRAFVASVSEMFSEQEMTNDQVIEALLSFDRSFSAALENKQPQNKITVEGHLSNYRYCEGVWTLNLTNAKFEGPEGVIDTPSIKIVAVEAKTKGKKSGKRG